MLEAANRATQHLYFTNPIMKLGQTGETRSWFATHPPLLDRINWFRQLRGQPEGPSPAEELAGSGSVGSQATGLG